MRGDVYSRDYSGLFGMIWDRLGLVIVFCFVGYGRFCFEWGLSAIFSNANDGFLEGFFEGFSPIKREYLRCFFF